MHDGNRSESYCFTSCNRSKDETGRDEGKDPHHHRSEKNGIDKICAVSSSVETGNECSGAEHDVVLHHSGRIRNKKFIESRTEGYDEFRKEILNLDIAELEKVSSVDRNLVREAAIAYASAGNAMSFHGLGVTEHSQGTFTVMLIADLAMITGNIGRRGVGVNPLRGQNNVQGAADMGCQPYQGAGYYDLKDPEVIQKYELFYKNPFPKQVGYKIPEMYDASLNDKLKAVWIISKVFVRRIRIHIMCVKHWRN